jgi:hypothetical protein
VNAYEVFERAYDVAKESYYAWNAWKRPDETIVCERAPTRRERLTLMQLAVVALEESAVRELVEACSALRKALTFRQIKGDPLNWLKGTYARMAGLRREVLLARLDAIFPPEEFLRHYEKAANGEEPQRE